MKFNVEKLKQMSRPMTESEKKELEFRRNNREWLAISERIALKLRYILRTENISQNELAARMEVTPAQITKILSGKENLGLRTICKIEKAIGKSLIEVPTDRLNTGVEFENRTTCCPFTINKQVAITHISTIKRKRSCIYSPIIAHNIFS